MSVLRAAPPLLRLQVLARRVLAAPSGRTPVATLASFYRFLDPEVPVFLRAHPDLAPVLASLVGAARHSFDPAPRLLLLFASGMRDGAGGLVAIIETEEETELEKRVAALALRWLAPRSASLAGRLLVRVVSADTETAEEEEADDDI